MTIRDLADDLSLKILSAGTSMDVETEYGYCCDLLSWVMANGRKNGIWITVQTHINIVAVASLLELAGIIIPSGIAVDPKTLSKAEEEGVTILSSDKSAFELCGILYKCGIRAGG